MSIESENFSFSFHNFSHNRHIRRVIKEFFALFWYKNPLNERFFSRANMSIHPCVSHPHLPFLSYLLCIIYYLIFAPALHHTGRRGRRPLPILSIISYLSSIIYYLIFLALRFSFINFFRNGDSKPTPCIIRVVVGAGPLPILSIIYHLLSIISFSLHPTFLIFHLRLLPYPPTGEAYHRNAVI